MREQGKSKAEMTSPGRVLWPPGSPMPQHSLSRRVLEGKTADWPTASPRGPGHALELGGTTWERPILQPRHPSAITPYPGGLEGPWLQPGPPLQPHQRPRGHPGRLRSLGMLREPHSE